MLTAGCRLTLYPSHALEPSRWLSSLGGHSSVAAAVLRSMDTEGYARGSHWYPGALPGLQEAAEPHSSDPQHSAGSPAQQDSDVVTAFHAAVAAARLQARDGQAQLANEGSAEDDHAAAPAAVQAASTSRAAMQGSVAGIAGPKASTPVPRRKGPNKLWHISVGQDGQMEGCKGPRQVGWGITCV